MKTIEATWTPCTSRSAAAEGKNRGAYSTGNEHVLHRLRMFQQRRFGTITLKHWIARNKMHHSERSYGDHTTATTPGDRRPDEVTA